MPDAILPIVGYVPGVDRTPLAPWSQCSPWVLTSQADAIVRKLLDGLSATEYRISDGVAVHRNAVVESGALLKAPLILGPDTFVAAGAYLRGGNWLGAGCSLGPGSELKSSFLLAGTRLAHFNFVGDSVLGEDVNLEAGSIVCNYRNERQDKAIRVRVQGHWQATGCSKFGALIGSHARIGANAVLAPGSVLPAGAIVRRASLHDDDPDPVSAGIAC